MAKDYYDDEEDLDSKDYLKTASEELKRVEHQVYVTLKYTRTVDVLLNIQQRMIDAYDALILALLKLKIPDEKDFPVSVLEKTSKVLELFNEPQIEENIQIYLLLRKIVKAKNIQKESEYRRPVKLKTIIEGQEVMIDIDIITHYFIILTSFYKYVEMMYNNEKLT